VRSADAPRDESARFESPLPLDSAGEVTGTERARRVAAGRADVLFALLEALLSRVVELDAPPLFREEPEERVAAPIGVLTSGLARPLGSALPRVAARGVGVARLVDSPLLGVGFSAGRTVLVFALMGSWSRFKVWLHPLPILAEGRRSRFKCTRV